MPSITYTYTTDKLSINT